MSHIRSVFSENDIALSPLEEGLFEQFLREFLAYNSHTNLSAIRDEEGVVKKHFLDSVLLLRYETLEGSLLDIGTGGGFPGIPLKILRPELSVTLLDSVSKKTKACDHFIATLGLSGIRSIWGRAEVVVQNSKQARNYDTIVSRATAYMPDILAWSEPFLAPKGKIVLYKTPSEEELADAAPVMKKLGLVIARTHEYILSEQSRKYFVIIKK